MSKRYPPIFNVILFIVAVCIILVNPMTMLMPWISTVTSFVVFAVSSIFNAVGLLLLPLFITCVSNIIYWLESPLLNI